MQEFDYKVVFGRRVEIEDLINKFSEDDWQVNFYFYAGQHSITNEAVYTAVLRRIRI